MLQLTVPINTGAHVISHVLGLIWRKESKWRSPKARVMLDVELPASEPPSSFLRGPVLTGCSDGEISSVSALPMLLQLGENHGFWAGRAGKITLRQSGLAALFWVCDCNCYWQQYFAVGFCFTEFLSMRFLRNFFTLFSFPIPPSLHPSILPNSWLPVEELYPCPIIWNKGQ